jgi:hypothetical protein
MAEYVGRNDPCPCGSGKKYKHCCVGKRSFNERTVGGVKLWALLAGLGVALAIVVGVSFTQSPPGGNATIGGGAGGQANPATAGPPGQAWEYDSLTNRHFDPTHNHWHEGPAPPPDQRLTPPQQPNGSPISQENPDGVTPQPYQFDSLGNRYWDPGHQHWHQGPPPAGVR